MNDVSDHHDHQVVVGDILLHFEPRITIIQVVAQLLSPTSSSTLNKPVIHRPSGNSSKMNGSQTIIPCDLKNTPSAKPSHERIKSSSSSKRMLRMHKAGLALVKELKHKVINSNHAEQKTLTVNTTDDHERTHL